MGTNYGLTCKSIRRLSYSIPWGRVQSLPGQLEFLGHIFSTTVYQQYSEAHSAVRMFSKLFLTATREKVGGVLEGMDTSYIPLNEWIHSTLRQYMMRITPNEDQYNLAFDKLEILIALGYAHCETGRRFMYWAPFGAFVHRHDNRKAIFREIRDSISDFGEQSPFV